MAAQLDPGLTVLLNSLRFEIACGLAGLRVLRGDKIRLTRQRRGYALCFLGADGWWVPMVEITWPT